MAIFDWLSPKTRQNPNQQSIQHRLKRDPYYRLQSTEEIAVAAKLGLTIDVNQAGVDDWLRLPGISIHQARTLFELTSSGVQFCCLEDLAAALGWSVQRLTPLQPILRFCYYDAESLVTPGLVNPNTASLEQLTKIPAVDLFLARAIMQNRFDGGPYRNLADLQRRLELNPQLTSELMYYLIF
ncbi:MULTISPECIES: ComEA family DNA-binding protein [Moorena]|uniref:DNA uptake protein family, DNA-binding protein n=1 Tax=Moorena producens 3L TaxID=489825 RepID=F4XT44_9CYAN|nr:MULTISPECIES: ComEA family DNA-binding protein [Moorena]NEQ13884.1 ComEA family DNA-binding protein [Moorena sp. SIO3E2]NES81455.1 ComEA family DNA-binding protein [Moorena sp. SIO2B7]EGJ32219.1 DNA uptake protein family, DNA-binding protein [Moorena producens 3L]NEP32830.1 ComEA family DNA-binding protein [Moorena sp. SIO3B2]NEP64443.1 ComEA family DNA-binding protein [Moorena sp. SIO3A5]